jgi:DNA-binding NarL/FixJ family response regulator
LNRISVMIVDDQHLFAESLKYVLQGESQGEIRVIQIAENGSRAVEFVRENQPDVILMDIRMPVMDGVEATKIIHKEFPQVKIMILTTFDDDQLAYEALNCGATGYVLKSIDPPDLVLSVKSVYKGIMFISPSVGYKLVGKMNPASEEKKSAPHTMITQLIQNFPVISMREAEIIVEILKAQRNKEIADSLSISEKTVKNHLSSIYEKMNIHSRIGLINHIMGKINTQNV